MTPIRRMLIAEDHGEVAETLREVFERAGLEAVACTTFEEAREMLLRQRFDLLVTDVRLGAFNGLQLAIIARERMPDIRIVVISGFDDPVLKMEAANLGAAYLLKPLTAERLLQLVDGNE